MSTENKHSPTPWEIEPHSDGYTIGCADQWRIVEVNGARTSALDKANAAHIVACVNGADPRTRALVEALEIALPYVEDCPRNRIDDLLKVRAALAQPPAPSAAAPAEVGWISVRDRLPEPYEDVMVEVASHRGDIYPRHLCINDAGIFEDEWGHLYPGKDPESTVLSWRPLPAPPTASEGGMNR